MEQIKKNFIKYKNQITAVVQLVACLIAVKSAFKKNKSDSK